MLTVALLCSKSDPVQKFRSTMHFHILMLLTALGSTLALPAAEVVSYIGPSLHDKTLIGSRFSPSQFQASAIQVG